VRFLNLGRRDGWSSLSVFLLTLFLYMTVRLTASPFGPPTGLGRDWPLGGPIMWFSQDVVYHERLFAPSVLGRSFYIRIHPPRLSDAQRPASDDSPAVNSMFKSGIRFRTS